MTEAMRWNRHKTRLSLICPHFAEDLARQLGVGENRYGAGNWKKGLQISEVLDSLKRHTAALERGEEVDPDTGLHHSVAITSNAMFLHYYHRTGQQDTLDDRHHKYRLGQVPPVWDQSAEDKLCPEPPGQERFSMQQMQEPGTEPDEEPDEEEREFVEDPVRDLQDRIMWWANKVFPDRTAHGALSKLVLEEIPELLNGGLDDPLEYADVLILILDVASLRGIDAIEASHQKMSVNEARSWEIDRVTGLMHHVEKETCGEKPVVTLIDAIQWSGKNVTEVQDFLCDGNKLTPAGFVKGQYVNIETLKGLVVASPGDWITKDKTGEFGSCNPDIFDKTHGRLDDD